jgi:hypothetical protein
MSEQGKFNAELEIRVLQARYEEHEKYSERRFDTISTSLEDLEMKLSKMQQFMWKILLAAAGGAGVGGSIVNYLGG